MGFLLRLSHWIDATNRWVGRGTFCLMLLLVLVGTFNTLARSFDKAGWLPVQLSSNTYLELQWYLFAAIFLLGAAYTFEQGAHVRVDVLYDRLKPRTRAWINVAGTVLLFLPFTGYVTWMSLTPVINSWKDAEMSSDAGGLPRYPIKTVIPVAFFLLTLQGVSELFKQLHQARTGRDEEVHGEELHV